MYSNYYVLQVPVKREDQIKKLIDEYSVNCSQKYAGEKIETIFFKKEVVHIHQDRAKIFCLPLFPGYLFVNRRIHEAVQLLRRLNVNCYVTPVAFNDKPARVYKEEMDWLLSLADETGVVRLTKMALDEDSEVRIIDGALKNAKGQILFVNRKKRKVKLRLNVFRREIDVSLGVDFVNLN